ncbi:hypothetical protein IV203_030222 [Nitzschia inconspicua]|uniref:Uncharacterized protein n=1 Tax=Nitzschia inconspicua TaxID=303405 RepID=A0A9K3LUZ1_9STRA|nr:hypothetical protein IV203_030222 [Nitzschia inconspicua]
MTASRRTIFYRNKTTAKKAIEEQQQPLGDPIPKPAPQDVLKPRDASLNNHPVKEAFPCSPLLEVPEEPVIENPSCVHTVIHDVLGGVGAFVDGHIGNVPPNSEPQSSSGRRNLTVATILQRELSITEIVQAIQALSPLGRFSKKADADSKSKDE